MTDLLFYTLDEMAEAKREAYEQGWHDALDNHMLSPLLELKKVDE